MEYIPGKTVTVMKANGINALNMEQVLIYLLMAILILVITYKENLMVKVSIPGLMEQLTLVSSEQVWNTVKESGAVPKDLLAIFTMVNTKTIKNTDLAASSGPAEISTKASILKMTEMDTEKCDGQMEVGTKANGTEVFSMDTARWHSQMEQWKKATSKTMCIRSKFKLTHRSSSSTCSNRSKNYIIRWGHVMKKTQRTCKNNRNTTDKEIQHLAISCSTQFNPQKTLDNNSISRRR